MTSVRHHAFSSAKVFPKRARIFKDLRTHSTTTCFGRKKNVEKRPCFGDLASNEETADRPNAPGAALWKGNCVRHQDRKCSSRHVFHSADAFRSERDRNW